MPDREHRDTRRVDLSADVPMPALAGRLLDVPEPTEEERAAALAEFRRRNAERAGGAL